MAPSLFALIALIILFAFGLFAYFTTDKRRWDRRRRKLFAPIERRKKARRRVGLRSALAWPLKAQLAKFVQPRPPAKPGKTRHS